MTASENTTATLSPPGLITITPEQIAQAAEPYKVPNYDRPTVYAKYNPLGFFSSTSWMNSVVDQNVDFTDKTDAKKLATIGALKPISAGLFGFFGYEIVKIFKEQNDIEPITVDAPLISSIDLGAMPAFLAGYYALAKFDKNTVSSIRLDRAEREELGIEKTWADTFKDTVRMSPRIAIVVLAGSVTVSNIQSAIFEPEADKYIEARIAANNSPIYQLYQGQLDAANIRIDTLRATEADLRVELVRLQQGGTLYSDAENQRLEEISEAIRALNTSKAEPEARKAEARIARDAAQTRLDAELQGARGAQAGNGPLAREARFDRDEAQRLMNTEDGIIAGINAQISGLNQERAEITQTAESRADNNQSRVDAQKETLTNQIAETAAQIDVAIDERDLISDVNARAEANPDFERPTDGILERIEGFYQYALDSNTPVTTKTFMGAAGMTLLALDFAVFIAGIATPTTPSERRQAGANIAIRNRQKDATEIEKDNRRLLRDHAASVGDFHAHQARTEQTAAKDRLAREIAIKDSNQLTAYSDVKHHQSMQGNTQQQQNSLLSEVLEANAKNPKILSEIGQAMKTNDPDIIAEAIAKFQVKPVTVTLTGMSWADIPDADESILNAIEKSRAAEWQQFNKPDADLN